VDDELATAYERCRELHKRHGRTYYLATRLLPAWKRRHVHALYGFTRYADEIVDRTDALPPAERAAKLRDWSDQFLAGLRGAPVDDPLLPAVLHTIAAFDLDRADFAAFLRSMAMDLTVTSYPTYADLLDYMEGSAAVIGTMMLPILGASDLAAAREPARQLGLAFQLTNFIRDVAEDLDRGRTYLPDEDLARFGVTRPDLVACAARRAATPQVQQLIEYAVRRAQAHYGQAASGVSMLEPASQACIRSAYRLYGGILDEIAAAGFDVFARRAVVPGWRKAAVAAHSLLVPAGTPVRVPGPPQLVAP
jgi:phytoene synthase